VTRLGVDVGGTFTDVVAVSPTGEVSVGKVRSGPEELPESAWSALDGFRRDETGEAARAFLIHGTTVATNALLERSGGRTVLVTTAGFEDLLWLRRQDRADLYDLTRDHPAPPVARDHVIGVRERIGATGVVQELRPEEVERVAAEVESRAPDAVAISLLFSFRDPRHERQLLRAITDRLPGVPTVVSYDVLPVFREHERTSTTLVEAYLRPVVTGYLDRMARRAGDLGFEDFRVMASNGGTLSLAHAQHHAAALALSGPAGGVEGARRIASQLGSEDLLTIDMGGTSADASVVTNGRPLMQQAGTVGGMPIALPHVLIETVGAGGGSLAWVDRGGALRVGPQSAGAEPGPACYGFGGTDATVTDAALVLGWLDPSRPLADEVRLDPARAERAVTQLAGVAGLSTRRCAEGIVEIATATMVRALRRVSVERGIDPRELTLVAFGGAGPMFACRLADSLGIRRALVPPNAGVLSALGLAAAPAKLERMFSFHRRVDDTSDDELGEAFALLERAALDELDGAAAHRLCDCRYPGQGYELTVSALGGTAALAGSFHDSHRDRYGHANVSGPVEIVNLRVLAVREEVPVRLAARQHRPALHAGTDRAYLPEVSEGVKLSGPFMLDAPDCTVRIEPDWIGTVHATGAVVLEHA
jgi:N-methylhydantoinase A